jgi:phosphoglycolate phosphatase
MTVATRGALLFDIDGTLTGTDPLHIRALNAMLAGFDMSITPDDYFNRVMGRTNAENMRDFFPTTALSDHQRLVAQKEATFRELAATDRKPTPGLIELMDRAESEGVAMAAVTSAPAPNAELMLTGLA